MTVYRQAGTSKAAFPSWTETRRNPSYLADKVITCNLSPHMETIMISPKAEVASMLEALSDDVSFEDIQYHLYVLEKVKRGLDRADTEGTLPHEEAKKRLHKWLAD
jgi:predicted transcriptional regulator